MELKEHVGRMWWVDLMKIDIDNVDADTLSE
jgi:hypothetical protein